MLEHIDRNDKVRLYGRVGQALIEAKRLGADPFAAIESVLPWEAFASSVSEAQKLAQPEDFDFLYRICESYVTLRRYAPEFLEVLKFRAAPAAEGVLKAIDVMRGINAENARKVPFQLGLDTCRSLYVGESPQPSMIDTEKPALLDNQAK